MENVIRHIQLFPELLVVEFVLLNRVKADGEIQKYFISGLAESSSTVGRYKSRRWPRS